MTPRLLAPLVVALCLLGTSSAEAAVTSCSGIGDGTACTSQCIQNGTCQAQTCVAIQLKPNGTACSSENRCSTNDTCQRGICVDGQQLVCPSGDSCHVGGCNPQSGCFELNICKPDLAQPVDLAPGQDLATVLVDMTFSVDLAGTDLMAPTGDMCFQPIGSNFQVCGGPDGPVVKPVDGGTDAAVADAAVQLDGSTDAATRTGHLRGSRPGDCSVAPGARPSSVGAFWLLLCGVAFLRRRTA